MEHFWWCRCYQQPDSLRTHPIVMETRVDLIRSEEVIEMIITQNGLGLISYGCVGGVQSIISISYLLRTGTSGSILTEDTLPVFVKGP